MNVAWVARRGLFDGAQVLPAVLAGIGADNLTRRHEGHGEGDLRGGDFVKRSGWSIRFQDHAEAGRKPSLVEDDHLSGIRLAANLERPTREL